MEEESGRGVMCILQSHRGTFLPNSKRARPVHKPLWVVKIHDPRMVKKLDLLESMMVAG
jgi:hypothetical protein